MTKKRHGFGGINQVIQTMKDVRCFFYHMPDMVNIEKTMENHLMLSSWLVIHYFDWAIFYQCRYVCKRLHVEGNTKTRRRILRFEVLMLFSMFSWVSTVGSVVRPCEKTSKEATYLNIIYNHIYIYTHYIQLIRQYHPKNSCFS